MFGAVDFKKSFWQRRINFGSNALSLKKKSIFEIDIEK